MKKVTSLLFAVIMALALPACGSNANNDASSQPSSAVESTTTSSQERQTTTTTTQAVTTTTQAITTTTKATTTTSTAAKSTTTKATTTTSTTAKSTTTKATTTTAKPTTTPTKATTTHIHNYSSATCTAPAKCSCGATNGSALGHKEVVIKAVAATCTATGLTEGRYCSVCNTIIKAQQTITPNGHNTVVDRAVAATCTKNGLTEGSHCSVCKTIIVAQKTTGLAAHSYGPAITAYNATCTSTGQIYYLCSACGHTLYYTTSKLSHNYENVRVYQAGMGWVYRPQCTMCGRGK